MSFCLHKDDLDDEMKEFLREKCTASLSGFDGQPRKVTMIRALKNGRVNLPIGMWQNLLDVFPNIGKVKCALKYRGPPLVTKEQNPERDQDVIVKQALSQLRTSHTTFLALGTGIGKTVLSIYLACQLKRKVLVLCHFNAVNRQFYEEFVGSAEKEGEPLRVQLVKGKYLDPFADVYIMGILKANAYTLKDYASIGVGTVIVDESHVAMETCFSKVLLKIEPEYLIGLSATPTRSDGMHKLYPPYFGSPKNFITRMTRKEEMQVFKVRTPFTPDVKYQVLFGKMKIDWTNLQNSLSYNEERQRYIVDLVKKIPETDGRIIVFCGRVMEAKAVAKLIEKEGITVSTFIESATTYDRSSRVLVATPKKAGVGFNDPTIRVMILAVDCKDVRQYEGRLRVFDGKLFDLVDNYDTLEKHWSERYAWYVKRGVKISVIGEASLSGTTRRSEKPREGGEILEGIWV